MRVQASGQASLHTMISAPQGGGHHDPSDEPVFMEKFVSMFEDEHRKGHFPDTWDPHKSRKPCVLSRHTDLTSTPLISTAPTGPDVQTISGLQQALKMLGYRIAVDGDYGPETQQAIAGFQMNAGIVADGIAGPKPKRSCF